MTIRTMCCAMLLMLAGTTGATEVSTLSALLEAIKANEDITLTADIDANDQSGRATFKSYVEVAQQADYTKTFNGGGHTIKGLTYIDESGNYYTAALFKLTNGATITDLNFTDVSLSTSGCAAALVGYDRGGTTIERCNVQSGSISSQSYAGGIVAISTNDDNASRSFIRNCENQASVVGSSQDCGVGGIIGEADHDLTIGYCRNYGIVMGPNNVGGLIGVISTDAALTVGYCISAGKVYCTQSDSNDKYGGILGAFTSSDDDQTVLNCLVTAEVYHNGSITANWARSIYNDLYGKVKNCFYVLPDGAGESQEDATLNTALTTAQVASGEATYLMNGKKATTYVEWRQNIDNEADKDALPFPCYGQTEYDLHAIVYQKGNCDDTNIVYTNSSENLIVHTYADDSDVCSVCGWNKTGTKEIYTINDLNQFAANVNKGRCENATLMADINLSAEFYDENEGEYKAEWYFTSGPIGTQEHPFTGTFEGNNHCLSYGLYDNIAQTPNVFGYVYNSTISNINLSGNLHSATQYGGLVGHVFDYPMTNTVIEGCYSNVFATQYMAGESLSGSLVGYNESSNLTIRNCSFEGVFACSWSETDNSYNVGGFVGCNKGKITFDTCVMAGEVTYAGMSNRGYSDDTKSSNFVINDGGTAEFTKCYYVIVYKWGETYFRIAQGVEKTKDDMTSVALAKELGWGLILDSSGYDRIVRYNLNDNKISFERYYVETEWTTVCLPFKIKEFDTDTYTLYYISDIVTSSETGETTIKVAPVSQNWQIASDTPGMPLLMKRKNSSIEWIRVDAVDDTPYVTEPQDVVVSTDSKWKATGTFSRIYLQGTDKYYIAQDQFWYAEDEANLRRYRCYLTYTGSDALSNSIDISLDDVTPTGITQVEGGKLKEDSSAATHKMVKDGRLIILKDGKEYTVTGAMTR